jgi:hypothetical protein
LVSAKQLSGLQLMVGSVDEALTFAQQRLRPFKQCRISQHQQQLLRETLALLAYPGTVLPVSYSLVDMIDVQLYALI